MPKASSTYQPPAIQTAVALTEHEAKIFDPPEEDVKPKTEHIQVVIEISQEFKEYLTKLRGDEARRALQARAHVWTRRRI